MFIKWSHTSTFSTPFQNQFCIKHFGIYYLWIQLNLTWNSISRVRSIGFWIWTLFLWWYNIGDRRSNKRKGFWRFIKYQSQGSRAGSGWSEVWLFMCIYCLKHYFNSITESFTFSTNHHLYLFIISISYFDFAYMFSFTLIFFNLFLIL